nr:uncharacterized protein LOC104646531 isoform X1 [Solanum lycopersicum]
MNIQQLKFLAKLALFFFIIVIATVDGYLTWLISTSASILLADLFSVLIHRYCPFISRLYHLFYLENPRRTRRHSDILAPLVALFVAPLLSHKLFDDINVTACMMVATAFYLPMMHHFGRPRNFRVLNVLFMLSVNICYGEFGFGPNTCASVAFFTYIAVLAGQAEAGAAYEDDHHHLTLNQIMSNLMIEGNMAAAGGCYLFTAATEMKIRIDER